MESKNEPKTLEEANYTSAKCCSWCAYGEYVGNRGGQGYFCGKFNKETSVDGVCDCYE